MSRLRWVKIMGLSLVSLLFLSILVLAGTAYWLVKTESGLRQVVSMAPSLMQRAVGQSLILELSKGTLWDGFTLKSAYWTDGKTNVHAKNVHMVLDAGRLWHRMLWIKDLSVDSIVVESQSEDKKPFVLPEKVDLPVSLRVDRLVVHSILVNSFELNELTAVANTHQNQLRLLQFSVHGEKVGKIEATADVVLQKPYALHSQVDVDRSFDSFLVKAHLKAKGSLERLELSLVAQGQDQTKAQKKQMARAQAVVMPFSPAIIEQVDAQMDNFNPQQWVESAPFGDFDLHAKLKPDAGFTHSVGELHVLNKKPQQIQKGGVPIRTLFATFDVTLKNHMPDLARVELNKVLFADGRNEGGSAYGHIQWRASTTPSADLLGNATIDLHTERLNAALFVDLPRPIALNSVIQGEKRESTITVKHLVLADGNAQVKGSGSLNLQGKRPVQLDLSVSGVNPANYVPHASPSLVGNLNGTIQFEGFFSSDGNLKKFNPFGTLNVVLDQSTLAKAPLVLKAQAKGGLEQLTGLDVHLDVLGNKVVATGAYGKPNDKIQLNIALNHLKELGRLIGQDLSGTANITGTLNGVGPLFAGDLRVEVDQLKLADAFAIESIHGRINLGIGAASPWVGHFEVTSVRKPSLEGDLLKSVSLQLTGTRNAHQLTVAFESGQQPFSRRRPLKGQLALRGGLKNLQNGSAGISWKGVLEKLNVEGLWSPLRSVVLEKPTSFELSSLGGALGDLRLKGEDSTVIHNKVLRVAGRSVELQGEIPAITFPRISSLLHKSITVEPKDLVAQVKWNYRSDANGVDGHLELARVSGDLQVLEDSEIVLPLKLFKLNVDFNREFAKLDFNMQANKFGVVQANVRLPVERNAKSQAWGLAMDKPLSGSVAASFTSLNWLGPLIDGSVRTSGSGQVAFALSGTGTNPNIQGRVFGRSLSVFQLDQGVRLEDGEVVIDLNNDRARIEQFQFLVYNRQVPRGRIEELGPLIQGLGKITASGQWNFSGLANGSNGGLKVKLDRVALLQRADRWVMMNANIDVAQPKVQMQPLRVEGQVDILGAYIEKPEAQVRTLGDDVFIRGRTEVTSKAGNPLDLHIAVNLGDLFFINAQGLRTRLAGTVRMQVQDGLTGSGRRTGKKLQAYGTIKTVDGTYRAYGQDLTIDRGVVNFQGPLDNPGLNVRAVRKGVAVEAGVEVTGTAQRPKVTLVSEPAVPDSEKLSWMIIGRGSNSSDRDATLLLTAAAAIFGDSDDSTTRKIAKSLGIDDLSLSSGSLTAADSRGVGSQVSVSPGADASASYLGAEDPLLTQRIISLGKKLSDKLYLSYEQSVTTAASILKLNYQYSRRLSFSARAGADTAIDTLYQFSYD